MWDAIASGKIQAVGSDHVPFLAEQKRAGIGEPLDIETVKSVMLVRANTLVKGYSVFSEDMIKFLLFMINENIIPVFTPYTALPDSRIFINDFLEFLI